MKLVFLQAATQDLMELRRYIVKVFGKATWLASFAKIKTAAALIRENPLKGNIPDELQTLNITTYRQILVGMNRIIYEPRAETVYIHIVCDSRRDLAGLLMRRLVDPDS